MKSRYNCAVPPQQSQSPSGNFSTHSNRSIANANSADAVASDYKLVLWSSSNGMRKNMKNASQDTISRDGDMDDTVCDLPAFMEDLGGPGGVASLILKQKRDSNSSTSSINSNKERKKILTVVLHGSSYLRQVWESLTCSWKDHITDLLLYYQDLYLPNNSSFPNSSRIISFEKTEPKKGKYTANSVFIRGMSTQGCHVFYPRPDMKDWFHPQVVLPPTIPGCSDDLAMVKFSHAIRFYFIMRQDYYQNLTHVYDELNLEPSDIDAMVFNMRNYSSIYPKDLKLKLRPGVLENSTLFIDMWQYEKLQNRDLNRWFGAVNPGIHKPPDDHPCMPGVPDDEANVLLYELLLRLS